MDQHLTSALAQLDCSPKEIRLFLASYSLGPAKIVDLAKKARMQRSTAYLLCEQMIQKRLFIDDPSVYGKKLTAITPDTLIRLLEAKKRRIGRSSINLTDNIEQLRDLYGSADVIPRISTYHGVTGLRTALSHILSSTTELLLWTNQESERHFFANPEHTAFVRDRIYENIPIRVLAVNNNAGKKLLESDTSSLRKTKLLPDTIHFTAETYIFESKVVIIDFTADIIAIVIENTSVHSAQAAQFEYTWSTL
ncbi:hypothetical protein EON76_02820 [bacterium]|nr:MAG: hypothetical protein EON76_02820 [bacterium]